MHSFTAARSLRSRIALAVLVVLSLMSATAVQAQAPTTLNYQGRLLQNDASQSPQSGTVDIVFSIWSGPTSDGAATQLWSESWTAVVLSNGVFSVLLGSNGSPLDPDDFQSDTSLFLQLQIDGETLSPRQQLGSAPFALVDEPGNEYQDIALTGNMLQLTNSTSSADLSGYLDNTDDQDLSLSGDSLSVTNDATPVDLSPYRDNTDAQSLSLSGNTLGISGSGTTVDLSAAGVDAQDLSLSGDSLELTNDATPVDLSPYKDNTDAQDLSISGDSLSLTNDATPVDLSGYKDNTDNQTLSLSGTQLQLTSDDGTDTVELSSFTNTDNQNLSLSGNTLGITNGTGVSLAGYLDNTDNQTVSLAGNNLSISGGNSVSLATFKDNTDNQDINSVLSNGTDANNRDITNLDDVDIDKLIIDQSFTCDASSASCITTAAIEQDTIGGNDIQDNIYILHIDCNGSCTDMSMKEACNVIENLRGLTVEVELIGVSCVYGVPSTTGNQFVPCNDGSATDYDGNGPGVIGDNECRAFNLRTLGDIPCINGADTDAIVTCLETDIAK